MQRSATGFCSGIARVNFHFAVPSKGSNGLISFVVGWVVERRAVSEHTASLTNWGRFILFYLQFCALVSIRYLHVTFCDETGLFENRCSSYETNKHSLDMIFISPGKTSHWCLMFHINDHRFTQAQLKSQYLTNWSLFFEQKININTILFYFGKPVLIIPSECK